MLYLDTLIRSLEIDLLLYMLASRAVRDTSAIQTLICSGKRMFTIL